MMSTDLKALVQMVELSKREPPVEAFTLVAQLLGVEPCATCDFRKTHCRCLPIKVL